MIPCHVQPRASREALLGIHDGALKVALTAPPVEGQANEALCRFMSKMLHLPKHAITVANGASSRRKVLAVSGISLIQAADLLGGSLSVEK